jgi:lipoate-protein ligase B
VGHKLENPAALRAVDLGLADYEKVFRFQQEIVDRKTRQPDTPDVVLVLEHPAVFTLGKRGGRENIVVPESRLRERGISVVQTQRGGNITFHGPGQLVVYPILDLERAGTGVADFVAVLEEAMIKTCADFGVTASRSPVNHGIWVKTSKIGSIGLTVRKGVSFHGLALNIAMDLEPFGWINPCGLKGLAMTSLEKEILALGRAPGPGLLPCAKERILDRLSLLLGRAVAREESPESFLGECSPCTGPL